jgi:diguanylate cyclase (GGDEF)-like protein/PAS domain S-box-containing protein
MTLETSEWMLWLAAASQKTSDISCLLDPQGRLVYLNPTAEHFLVTPELTQMLWATSLEELDTDASLHHLEVLQHANNGESWSGLLKLQYKTHAACLFAATVVPLLSTEGEVARYHLSAKELTSLLEPPALLLDSSQQAQMMELLDDVVSLHDPHLNTLYATPALKRLTGFPTRQLIGRSAFLRMHPDDQKKVLRALRALKRRGETTVRWRHSTRSGEWIWLETRVRSLDESWAPARYLCSSRDIGPQIASEERVLWRARHDILTELSNRSYFQEQVNEATTKLPQGQLLATLFLDLDGFKRINDSLGHETGDTLLRVVAQRLHDTLRGNDVIGRMGGDEFTILLNPVHSREEIEVMVRRLLAAVARPVLVNGQELFVSASIGISTFPDDGKDAETLIRHADVAMYRAKQAGNSFRHFANSMNDDAQERLRQERCLRRALEWGEFEMHYQPQTNPTTGEINHMEALLRWNRPEGESPISPARFIAIAEECGLIEPLGSWILQNVCEQVASWQKVLPHCPTVAVNVSTLQLTQPWFLRRVEQTLEATGLPARLLEIEITESALLDRKAVAIRTLDGLHQLGTRLAVDDFGTGYSSLSYLRDLPLDCLKIDATFLVDMLNAPQTQAIIRAIIELSHALDLEVVAEGVEYEEQRRILAELGCDRIQGFLVSPAVSAATIPELLERLHPKAPPEQTEACAA